MKYLLSTMCLLVAIFICGCNQESSTSNNSKSEKHPDIFRTPAPLSAELSKLIGGEKAAKIIYEADTVVAHRLSHGPDTNFNIKVISEPIELDQTQASNLIASLTSHNSYMWDIAKGCAPIWGIKTTFTKGDEKVEILYCFECNILRFVGHGSEDFDKIRSDLLKILKPLFPDDKAIQALK